MAGFGGGGKQPPTQFEKDRAARRARDQIVAKNEAAERDFHDIIDGRKQLPNDASKPPPSEAGNQHGFTIPYPKLFPGPGRF